MGGGSVMDRLEVVEEVVMGQVVRSWVISDWAQRRAVLARRVGGGEGGRGDGSWQRRLPRSKVGGMGFGGVVGVVVVELEGGVSEEMCVWGG